MITAKSQRKLKNEVEKAWKGKTAQQESVKAQEQQPCLYHNPFSVSQDQGKLETPQGGTEYNCSEEKQPKWQQSLY